MNARILVYSLHSRDLENPKETSSVVRLGSLQVWCHCPWSLQNPCPEENKFNCWPLSPDQLHNSGYCLATVSFIFLTNIWTFLSFQTQKNPPSFVHKWHNKSAHVHPQLSVQKDFVPFKAQRCADGVQSGISNSRCPQQGQRERHYQLLSQPGTRRYPGSWSRLRRPTDVP